jgi:hypothetical protein
MKKIIKYLMLVATISTVAIDPSLGQSLNERVTGANLLNNGGFEIGKPIDFGSIPGWEAAGNIGARPVGFSSTKLGSIPSYLPKEGLRMSLFSAGNNDFSGSLSQLFKTVTGTTYLVKLKMGIVTESAGRGQVLQVSIANGDGAFILSRVENIISPTKGTTWMEFSAQFVAAGNQTCITLTDLSEILPLRQSYNSDLLIDDVRIAELKPIKTLSKFEKWMIENRITGNIIDDFDKDTLSNGVEYVIGTNPKIKTASSNFPKSSLSFSGPDGDGKKLRYVVFSYKRSKIALDDAKVSVIVEWRGTNKDNWKSVSSVKGHIVKTSKNKYLGNVDLVSVYIPRTITKSGNFFTRLRVVSKQ